MLPQGADVKPTRAYFISSIAEHFIKAAFIFNLRSQTKVSTQINNFKLI